MTTKVIDYEIAFPTSKLAASGLPPCCLFKYIFAANGIFVYSKSEMIEALIPIRQIVPPAQMVRGLDEMLPFVWMRSPVPAWMLHRMVELSRRAVPNEILFQLTYKDEWKLTTPPQVNGAGYVKPLESAWVPVEVHSHNTMGAFFSEQDDQDETGFRIYAVLGEVDKHPVAIKVRASVYGHRATIPYDMVFERCNEVIDVP